MNAPAKIAPMVIAMDLAKLRRVGCRPGGWPLDGCCAGGFAEGFIAVSILPETRTLSPGVCRALPYGRSDATAHSLSPATAGGLLQGLGNGDGLWSRGLHRGLLSVTR